MPEPAFSRTVSACMESLLVLMFYGRAGGGGILKQNHFEIHPAAAATWLITAITESLDHNRAKISSEAWGPWSLTEAHRRKCVPNKHSSSSKRLTPGWFPGSQLPGTLSISHLRKAALPSDLTTPSGPLCFPRPHASLYPHRYHCAMECKEVCGLGKYFFMTHGSTRRTGRPRLPSAATFPACRCPLPQRPHTLPTPSTDFSLRPGFQATNCCSPPQNLCTSLPDAISHTRSSGRDHIPQNFSKNQLSPSSSFFCSYCS